MPYQYEIKIKANITLAGYTGEDLIEEEIKRTLTEAAEQSGVTVNKLKVEVTER